MIATYQLAVGEDIDSLALRLLKDLLEIGHVMARHEDAFAGHWGDLH